jgi:hypothetical protein
VPSQGFEALLAFQDKYPIIVLDKIWERIIDKVALFQRGTGILYSSSFIGLRVCEPLMESVLTKPKV